MEANATTQADGIKIEVDSGTITGTAYVYARKK